jgi:hypothetical protein
VRGPQLVVVSARISEEAESFLLEAFLKLTLALEAIDAGHPARIVIRRALTDLHALRAREN